MYITFMFWGKSVCTYGPTHAPGQLSLQLLHANDPENK